MSRFSLSLANAALVIGFAMMTGSSAVAEKIRPITPVDVSSRWFSVGKIDPDTYVIEERRSSQGNVSYLILGSKRAVMIDTGTGENRSVGGSKIMHIIEQLTDLPVTLLPSHFHFDHVANIEEFGHVAFPDLPFLRENISDEGIYYFSQEELVDSTRPEKTRVDEWLPLDRPIDLGAREIRLVHLPGHSRETIVIIDDKRKYAFLGDFLYSGPVYVLAEKDLEPYAKSAKLAIKVVPEGARLFGGHGRPEVPRSYFQKLPGLLDCVLAEKCEAKAGYVFAFPALTYTYKKMKLVLFTDD